MSSKYLARAGSRAALLSVGQVAQLLGVSTAIVYRLCERSELAHCRVSQAIRITAADLAAYVDQVRRR